MLVVVLQSNSGVGDGEDFEAVEAGFGALRGVQVEGLSRVEGAV
jgi:hypothetical protein